MEKIVIDIYGADAGPAVILAGVAAAIERYDITPVLVGDRALIDGAMAQAGIHPARYEVVHATDYITNDEPATVIFGGRDESSVALAYKRLREDDECVALLSAGNTGALLVGSICRLGLVTGIKSPALCSALPCAGDTLLCLVDCGAVIDCTAADLVRFAKMGNVFSRACCGVESPRVGLMSVGREDAKGSALTLEAFAKLKEVEGITFVGNVEGSDMVSGYADVIVTDGFTGNVLLKNTEAVGRHALAVVEEVAADDPALAARLRTALLEKFDFNSRGAATFLGPKKPVLKMHGCATAETVVASVDQALRLQKAGFSAAIAKALG